ncbi:MAG: extensin family protein [Paracoccus sp. (in: a-proteobacteria)]|nr:extensin family protein [Paracoccus sp. (in: a-proteobacteria)]
MGGADDPSAAKPDPARGPEPAPVSSAPAETGEAPSGSRPPAARPDAANISATAAADDNAADDTGDSDSDSDSDGPQPDAENAGGTAADDGSAADRGDPGPGEDMPSDAGADPQAVSATDDGPQPADDARAASAHAAADAAAGPPAWQLLAEDDFTYQSCLLGLFMLGVEYQELPAIADEEDRDCGIARPLNITAVQPGLSIAGGAVMRCDTARRLARWARDFALPAAAQLSGAPRITALIPGSTYQCRARVGTGQARLSEHALGNAFDLSALQLSDGREIAIAPRDGTGTLDEALQKTLHHAGCLYFTTVLGPGSNAAHDDHLHFDIMTRKNDWRLCE